MLHGLAILLSAPSILIAGKFSPSGSMPTRHIVTNQYESLSKLIPDLNHPATSPPQVQTRDSFHCGPISVLTECPSANLKSVWEGESSADWRHSAQPSVVIAYLARDVPIGVQVEIYITGAFGMGWRPLAQTPSMIARSASSTEARTEHLTIYYRVSWLGPKKVGSYSLEIAFEGTTP